MKLRIQVQLVDQVTEQQYGGFTVEDVDTSEVTPPDGSTPTPMLIASALTSRETCASH